MWDAATANTWRSTRTSSSSALTGKDTLLTSRSAQRGSVLTHGSRSNNLAAIAIKHHPHSAVVADILALPHPAYGFDFAISIAVVHHLSTRERRIEAVAAVLDTLRSGGRALIYVWALEQESSRRGWSEGDDQDVMVPWVLREPRKRQRDDVDSPAGGGDKVFHRFYHLYCKGELEADIASAGGIVLEAGYEKDNWWAIASRGTTVS